MRTLTGDDQAGEDCTTDSAPEPGDAAGAEERPALRVVQARRASSTAEVVEPVAPEVAPPQIQCDAWAWALSHRREDGSLPSGQEIAEQFGRKPRWGRLSRSVSGSRRAACGIAVARDDRRRSALTTESHDSSGRPRPRCRPRRDGCGSIPPARARCRQESRADRRCHCSIRSGIAARTNSWNSRICSRRLRAGLSAPVASIPVRAAASISSMASF